MTAPEIRARKMIAKLSLPKLLDQWNLQQQQKMKTSTLFADG